MPQGLDHYWTPTPASKCIQDWLWVSNCKLNLNWKIPMSTLIWMACHAGGTQWLSPTKYTFCWEGTTWFTSGVIPCNWDLFCTPFKNLNTYIYIYWQLYNSVTNWYNICWIMEWTRTLFSKSNFFTYMYIMITYILNSI